MKLPPLVPGTLLRRYKRFLADVKLDSGPVVTAHCPNTGSMLGCCEPGRRVYLSRHNAPTRKYPFTWQLIRMPGTLVGVNTMFTNHLVREAIDAARIRGLDGFQFHRAEPPVAAGARLDLLLSHPKQNHLYLEIKNCSLVRDGTAAFPDAVTTRGQKHLTHLMTLKKQGFGAAILFLIQREDATAFSPARDIDPLYTSLLQEAARQGVLVLAHSCRVTTREIRLAEPLPIGL